MAEEQKEQVTYDSGAKRSAKNPRYRDIDFGLLKRIGEAFSEGAVKYENDLMPYEKNWKNGDLDFALDVLDHAIEHLYLYKENVLRSLNRDPRADEFTGEDHLGHLGANLVMLDYFDRRGFFNPDNYESAEVPPEPVFEPPVAEEPAEGSVTPPAASRISRILAGLGI